MSWQLKAQFDKDVIIEWHDYLHQCTARVNEFDITPKEIRIRHKSQISNDEIELAKKIQKTLAQI